MSAALMPLPGCSFAVQLPNVTCQHQERALQLAHAAVKEKPPLLFLTLATCLLLMALCSLYVYPVLLLLIPLEPISL